jgi:hypothetical protein
MIQRHDQKIEKNWSLLGVAQKLRIETHEGPPLVLSFIPNVEIRMGSPAGAGVC